MKWGRRMRHDDDVASPLHEFRWAVHLPHLGTSHRYITAHLFREHTMLMTLAIILVVLWLLGMVSAYTMGGLIHILLVIAVVVILVRVIQGRKVL